MATFKDWSGKTYSDKDVEKVGSNYYVRNTSINVAPVSSSGATASGTPASRSPITTGTNSSKSLSSSGKTSSYPRTTIYDSSGKALGTAEIRNGTAYLAGTNTKVTDAYSGVKWNPSKTQLSGGAWGTISVSVPSNTGSSVTKSGGSSTAAAPKYQTATQSPFTGMTWQQVLQEVSRDPARWQSAAQQEIQRAGEVWQQAMARGDVQSATAAHNWANQLRNALGLRAGVDYNARTGALIQSQAPSEPSQPPVVQQPDLMQQLYDILAQPPVSMQDVLSQLNTPLQQYSWPYEELYRQVIAQAPSYTVPSEEELQKIAEAYASVQYDPQLSELERSLASAKQALEAQKAQAEAAYASYDTAIKNALDTASRKALESAIARGGGTSGAVEWLMSELSKPIMEKGAEVQAERTATLNDIAEKLALAEQQAAQKREELAKLRGAYIAAKTAELKNTGQSNAADVWKTLVDSSLRAGGLGVQADQAANSAALDVISKILDADNQRRSYILDIINAFGRAGSVPTDNVFTTTYSAPGSGSVVLRDYVESRGGSVSYDPVTGAVIINGKVYLPSELKNKGGQLVNGRWVLPERAAAAML